MTERRASLITVGLMELRTFFDELKAEVVTRQRSFTPEEIYGNSDLSSTYSVFLSHLNMLIQLADCEGHPKGCSSVVRSSWGTVRRIGIELRLFERYKGNEELREKLRAFVTPAE